MSPTLGLSKDLESIPDSCLSLTPYTQSIISPVGVTSQICWYLECLYFSPLLILLSLCSSTHILTKITTALPMGPQAPLSALVQFILCRGATAISYRKPNYCPVLADLRRTWELQVMASPASATWILSPIIPCEVIPISKSPSVTCPSL